MTVKIIRTIARYLIGLVFIFSGFVKAIDPLGSTYKLSDYFKAFGFDGLVPLAFGLAVLLSSLELMVGLNLILRLRMRFTAWVLLVFMVFFTLLTLVIAIKNPVTDCGCFGDALILTNWQTFYKNIIFLIPTLIIFFLRKTYLTSFRSSIEWTITSVLTGIAVLLSVYCYYNLPLIDFRPYKIGTHLQSAMEIPEGEPMDEYKTVLVYEKNGVEKEFTLESPEKPWSDSTWKWVETKNILIKKGYVPPIHDFTITTTDGEEVTNRLLTDDGYSLLVVSYDLEKANKKGLEKIVRTLNQADEQQYSIYALTASSEQQIKDVKEKYKPKFEFYNTDEIALKTMVRSNPALIMIKGGTVIGMWHYRNIPEAFEFKQQGLSLVLNQMRENSNKRLVTLVTLFILSLSLFLLIFREVFGKSPDEI